MARQLSCAKCGGRMEAGAVLNRDSNGARALVSWIEGRPARSIWTGLKIKGLRQFPLTSYRCERCGYLENYAETP